MKKIFVVREDEEPDTKPDEGGKENPTPDKTSDDKTTPSSGISPETPNKVDSPKTGYNTNLWIFIGFFLAAFIPFTVYVVRKAYKAHK